MSGRGCVTCNGKFIGHRKWHAGIRFCDDYCKKRFLKEYYKMQMNCVGRKGVLETAEGKNHHWKKAEKKKIGRG